MRGPLAALIVGAFLAGCAAVEPPAPIAPLDIVEADPFEASVRELRDAILAGTATLEGETSFLLVDDPRYLRAKSFEVELKPSTLVSEDIWAELDGAATQVPFVETYAGHVMGEPDQVVRLTLTHEWAAGTIRVDNQNYRIRVNMDGNFPAGYPLQAPEGRVAAPPSTWHFDRNGVEPHDCLSLLPMEHSPLLPGRAKATQLVAKVVLDGDAAYLQRLEHHAFPMMVAFLNEVDGIYDHQLGIRFQVVGLHLHSDPEALSQPETQSPLGQLAAYWNERPDLDRDIVHLYTGWESSYAQANCIGGAGMPELAYTFTPIQWAQEEYGILRHTQTYAHELGHIFNAHHHYGNPLEAGVSTTIMHQGAQKINPAFSTLSRDVIRGWAEAHLD
jgi:hypothetical protein